MVDRLSWPTVDAELIQNLIAVIDADFVPFANKSDPLACLAFLTLRSPVGVTESVCEAVKRWIEKGISGRDLSHMNPLSIGQVTGFGPESIVTSFAFLIDVLARKRFDVMGHYLAKWVLLQGIRQPVTALHRTFVTAIRCSMGVRSTDHAMSVALIGIAEAIANVAVLLEPEKIVGSFTRVMTDDQTDVQLKEWLSSPPGNLFLELWQNRLFEVSVVANASAREAVARAVRNWESTSPPLPDKLRTVRDRLAIDCRLRVRAALSR